MSNAQFLRVLVFSAEMDAICDVPPFVGLRYFILIPSLGIFMLQRFAMRSTLSNHRKPQTTIMFRDRTLAHYFNGSSGRFRSPNWTFL